GPRAPRRPGRARGAWTRHRHQRSGHRGTSLCQKRLPQLVGPRLADAFHSGERRREVVNVFRIAFTGDFLNASGNSAYGDMGLDRLDRVPYVSYRFLKEHMPRPDPAYWQSLYSMEVTAGQLRDVDGLVVLRPWIKRDALRDVAAGLVMIGRSGAGYDKIDVAALTENNVALFNAPLALNHSTASSALLFMLALA